jgi:predicted esterase
MKPVMHYLNCKWFLYIFFFLIEGISAQFDAFEAHVFVDQWQDTLPYRLLKPLHEDSTKSYPLVLFLHGAGDVGNDNISQLNNFPQSFLDSINRQTYPCYVIAPQCPADDSWDSFPDYPYAMETSGDPTLAMGMVLTLIDSLRGKSMLHLDTNRVYATGFSLGGEGTFDIITRAPNWFAAAVPISGLADTGKAYLMKNVPFWIFAGSLDDVNPVKYDRMIVQVLKRLGNKPKYTEYKNFGHECWDTAYNEPALLPWLFAQNRSSGSAAISESRKPQAQNVNGLFIKNQALIITWSSSFKADEAELFSLNGKCVFKYPINAASTTIPIPQYVHGIYLLKLVDNGRSVYTQALTLLK